MAFEQGKISLYYSKDGSVQIDVRLENETVWLIQTQIQELFGRERSVITRHINIIFKEGKFEIKAVCVEFARTAEDGKKISGFPLQP